MAAVPIVFMDVPTYAYILRNPKGQFFVGTAERVDLSIHQHNSGAIDLTRFKGPWELVWAQAFKSNSEAQRLEGLLKRQKGTPAFTKMTGLAA